MEKKKKKASLFLRDGPYSCFLMATLISYCSLCFFLFNCFVFLPCNPFSFHIELPFYFLFFFPFQIYYLLKNIGSMSPIYYLNWFQAQNFTQSLSTFNDLLLHLSSNWQEKIFCMEIYIKIENCPEPQHLAFKL